MSTAYRLHPAGESPETCKDAARPVGWQAGEEDIEAGHGVAVCSSVRVLVEYARMFSMHVAADDTLVRLEGAYTRGGEDGMDDYMVAASVEVIGSGVQFAALGRAVTLLDEIERWEDEGDIAEMAALVADPVVAMLLAEYQRGH
jgi:hypothetical protein